MVQAAGVERIYHSENSWHEKLLEILGIKKEKGSKYSTEEAKRLAQLREIFEGIHTETVEV